MTRRLIVVGAGPIGLAAALGAVRRGLDVTVLEADAIGASLRGWGPVRAFSPLAMNLPIGAAALLGVNDPEALLTGAELVTSVLEPLARSAPLAGRVLVGHRVVSIARAGLTRGELAGHPIRGERRFRLLVDGPDGERWDEADVVLDASGVYGQPSPIGAGAMAPGERALGGRAIRHLGALAARLHQLAGRRICVIGHGHSAAHALGWLDALARETPDTRVVWAVRSLHARPCVEVASDPLPERARVVGHANQLATRPPPWLRVERRAAVVGLAAAGDEAVAIRLSGDRTVEADHLIALTGYRPDRSLVAELAVDLAPATEGAAGLTRALAAVTDCLAMPSVAPADLASGEPGFHLIGAKSYGRASTFLLRTGYAQVELVLDGLA